jgi:branched-chain amino acid transport system ATP-binding protein
MLGAHSHVNTGLLAGLLGMTRRNDVQLAQECQALMAFAGVESALEAHATQLSFGVLKRLEIARALAVKPRLLLLDEPAAGLNETETGEITALIRKIAASGVTVVLVEHDMKMVMSVSDQVVVLDQGRKIAEGTPSVVSSNPLVVAAYLGTEV